MRIKIVSVLLALFAFQGCESDDEGIQEVLTSGDIDTFAGTPGVGGHTGEGGDATDAQLSYITGISVDQGGNVYFTDGASNTVHKVTVSDGKIHKIGGVFLGFNVAVQTPFFGDGGPATSAHIWYPQALTVDGSSNVIISDAANMRLRHISGSTGTISTLVGTGNQGFTGDGDLATAASVWNPFGIDTDASGNIYFADSQNNVIRKITVSTGVITTIAGIGPDDAGFSGDNGPATSAKLHTPAGVAIGADGSIYISDSGNNRIRKITGGTIITIAGTGAEGSTGDGGAATSATFISLKGIAVDSDGNVYICNSGNSTVRKITASDGKISTFAGTGAAGFSGDGGPANEARLSNPQGVAVDTDGNVYIADTWNSVIRVVIK